ncbi:Gamma-tubulin complex component 3 [Taenia solium]|eukprot:TsM_000034900 transcript=TsM_000034900 gene=TsM_000034900
MEDSSMEQRAKERIFRLFDKSPICILHEYCQSVLHVQSTFKPLVIENDKQLFHYAVVINNVTYPTGSGNSKKLARSEAARLALFEILPEYKAFFEEKKQSGSLTVESSGSILSEADLDLFREVSVTDRQVYDIVTTRQLNCAAPYTIFGEYVKRHCIPEGDVHSNMSIHGKNNHIYEISVGEHRVQVHCKNKRAGRNYAAQEMLAKLHPQVRTWAELLELYGPNTKPDRRSDNEAILDAQTRHSNSVKTGVIRILKAKMLELSNQWLLLDDFVDHLILLAISSVSPVEQDLLREAILTLSGASGSLIQYDPTLDAFTPAPNLTLSPSMQTHILRISVCGWLYNRIRSFVDGVREDPNSGKVALSLALSIDEQLTEYLRLVTTLEAQMNRDLDTEKFDTNLNSENVSRQFSSAAPSIHSLVDGSQSEMDPGKQPLTLVQLSHWLMEPKRRLKILASLADICASLKGGALVSKVYEMSQNGGPQIQTMLTTILVNVTRTIFEMISLWIYDGRLTADTNQEFFITVNPSVDNSNLWTDKYGLRKSMVPVFISKEQARKILLVGKSVNFLTHVCDDSLVFKDLEAIRNTRLKRIESIFDQVFDNSFDRMISTAYTHISKHLLRILFDKYHFVDHLTACRKFLLLGQGDFIQRLMDLLEPELGLPAEDIMRHRLNEILETAIRDTNAQYEDSEILQRLNVEILETADGDSGWDIFSLGYTVDGPLSTIFTPDCRLFYLKAFSFLWRLKRMEFSLSALWRDQLLLARLPHGLSADLTPVLHVVQLLGAEFRHFVLQLQYYVNFEALECAWVALGAKLHSANDLDEVIEAHKTFLGNVISRCLLDQNSRDLRYHLRAIFDVIVNFSQLNQDLQDLATDELVIRSQLQDEIEASARTGQWGTCDTPESREMARRRVFVESTVSPLIARIRVLAASYRSMVTEFMSMLQNHTDRNLRLLVQNLNFNVHYIDGFMEA